MSRPKLSPNHERMLLEESGIAPEVVKARGYRTAETKAELERLGFGRSQRNVPTIILPIYNPAGEIVLYQTRPDEPRIKEGEPVKYETPFGSTMTLDVHPAARDRLGDPSIPLFVTEGIKKGDALVSQDLCAIALIGVWNFRGSNEYGGKTALADWEYVALNGRKVYVVFDSDVMEKWQVYDALCRLTGLLEHRGAEVLFMYLPPDDGGKKQGVDDYLAAGHTKDDLLALATHELRKPPREERPEQASSYRETPDGLVWEKPTQNGSVPTLLTNFGAKIVADMAQDDGAEERRVFEIEATLNGRVFRFGIPSGQFAGMGWATEYLGANALVYPGQGTKDHARTAIQLLSGDVPTRNVYSHTGWRRVGEEWAYLHADGAIGQVGQVEDIHTELTGNLAERGLPDPPEGNELNEAIQATLRLLEVAPGKITTPLLASVYRAALGDSDFSIHVSGPSGEGKSELGALCQQHFGAGLDARHLTSWESTENAIEGQAFQAKDQVMVLDDFAPTGTTHDVQRWHKKADRVLRAKGNASGRQRMRPDTTLRPEKPPRALIVSTGEDIPRGQSLRARMQVLEMGPGELDWKRLTECQRDAAQGLYARAMSGYAHYVASRYEEIRSGIRSEHAALREAAARDKQHRRTPGIVADLALGLRYFLTFAHEAGALTSEQAEKLWERSWKALGEAAAAQVQHQAAGEPTQRFGELLSAAIASGRAHLAGPAGDTPNPKENPPQAWGWAGEVKVRNDGDTYTEWRHQGDRVGWIDGGDLYLEPEASFAAAQKQGRDSGESLTITGRTLRKRLDERGLLLSTGKELEGRDTLSIRHELGGMRRSVLHLSSGFLSPQVAEPDRPDHDGEEPHTYADPMSPLWSGQDATHDPLPDRERNGQVSDETRSDRKRRPKHEPDQQKYDTYVEESANGQVGQVFDVQGDENGGGDARRVRGLI